MKKNILFIIEGLKSGGGAERVVASLTTKLSTKYNVYILTIKDFKDKYPYGGKYYSFQDDISSFSKVIRFLRLYNIKYLIKTYKTINSISPDIIISVLFYTNLLTIVTKILFRIKIPLLIPIHFNPKLAYKTKFGLPNFLMKLFYRPNFIDKIITVSKETEYIFEKNYGFNRNKLKTIYNGVDLNKIERLKEEKISEYEDIFNNEKILKFIIVGRLFDVKGHKYLIEAFSKVKIEIPNSKLIIIGDGPLREYLENLTREKNLENDILFLGYRQNPFKYIAKSDIFTLSSKYEGLPMVLIEALACGIPIISTNCKTGPKEVLDNGRYGILVKVMDSEDLADKMISLAKNKENLKIYSKKSLERAKFFDISKFFNEWISLLEEF